jgi:hypothetical protein
MQSLAPLSMISSFGFPRSDCACNEQQKERKNSVNGLVSTWIAIWSFRKKSLTTARLE